MCLFRRKLFATHTHIHTHPPHPHTQREAPSRRFSLFLSLSLSSCLIIATECMKSTTLCDMSDIWGKDGSFPQSFQHKDKQASTYTQKVLPSNTVTFVLLFGGLPFWLNKAKPMCELLTFDWVNVVCHCCWLEDLGAVQCNILSWNKTPKTGLCSQGQRQKKSERNKSCGETRKTNKTHCSFRKGDKGILDHHFWRDFWTKFAHELLVYLWELKVKNNKRLAEYELLFWVLSQQTVVFKFKFNNHI